MTFTESSSSDVSREQADARVCRDMQNEVKKDEGMTLEEERTMYVHALMKWDYLRKNPLVPDKDTHRDLPVLNKYSYGCSFCNWFQHDGCVVCPLSIVGQRCVSGGHFSKFVCAVLSDEEKEATHHATQLYCLIREYASERGFVIGEEEYAFCTSSNVR